MIGGTTLIVLVLAMSAAASRVQMRRSPVTLPISRRINATNIRNLVRHDQTRVLALKLNAPNSDAALTVSCVSVASENLATAYIASVGVGTPATFCKSSIETNNQDL